MLEDSMDEKLLSLPWQIQLALGSGYLAYQIAYAGIRQHHSATDTIFRAFAFGLVGTAVILWAPLKPIYLEVVAFSSTLIAGVLWRWIGMEWTRKLLSMTNVSWSDDIQSAWTTITATRTDVRPSQIVVDLDDGRTLLCEDTRRFANAPFGPCVYGLDGSVALYVTDEMRSDGTWIEKPDVENSEHGPLITYIPATSIRRVEIRMWIAANGKVCSEVAPVVQEQAP